MDHVTVLEILHLHGGVVSFAEAMLKLVYVRVHCIDRL
jgi:hypothetical protein